MLTKQSYYMHFN